MSTESPWIDIPLEWYSKRLISNSIKRLFEEFQIAIYFKYYLVDIFDEVVEQFGVIIDILNVRKITAKILSNYS